MAVPDGRASFDHFRMPTRLSDWLFAFHHQLDRPSPETIFDFRANAAEYHKGGISSPGCDITFDDPRGFLPQNDLRKGYAEYLDRLRAPQGYQDTHCTITFGVALENMLWDLRFLGLIDLEVIEVTETLGLEFFVHLRKPESPSPLDETAFYAARAQRQRQIADSLGSAGFGRPGPGQTWAALRRARLLRSPKAALTALFPERTVAAVREWNRRRKLRRPA